MPKVLSASLRANAMQVVTDYTQRGEALTALFATTFGASEGEEEGALIGALVQDLMSNTPEEDLYLFANEDAWHLIAAVFMSRLTFAGEDRSVFMLAPVAVAPNQQGKGVGQSLIRHALDQMKSKGVDIVVTYGDPNYYSRVGFCPVITDVIPAPVPLQYPHGWQAQSLSGDTVTPLKGPATCVSAFDDPAYW